MEHDILSIKWIQSNEFNNEILKWLNYFSNLYIYLLINVLFFYIATYSAVSKQDKNFLKADSRKELQLCSYYIILGLLFLMSISLFAKVFACGERIVNIKTLLIFSLDY